MSYGALGRHEEALRLKRDVYSGRLKLYGEEHEETLHAANNYAADLIHLERLQEAKSLFRKTMSVALRVLGNNNDLTLKMRWLYSIALSNAEGATLDESREAVATLEDTERTARRVMGGAHPITRGIEVALRNARAALRASEIVSILN